VIDCFDGLVVSWTIGTRPDAELVNTMLDVAISTVANSEERPVVHSDRGAHYRWPGWLSRIMRLAQFPLLPRKDIDNERDVHPSLPGRHVGEV
jgi:transposase InsO family protein